MALLTLGFGLCLFHGDEHGSALDLCFALLAAALTVPAVAGLPLAGWTVAHAVSHVRMAGLHTPAPPPKSASLL